MLKQTEIQLSPLTAEQAQVVRKWRNSEHIRQFMDFKGHITEEDQLRWFKSLKPDTDRYYFILHQGEGIGLIHLNKIDKLNGDAYAGLFIGKKEYHGTGAAYFASIKLLDEAFQELNLERVYAKVSERNLEAQAYNKSLGFEKVGSETSGFIKMAVTKEQYDQKKAGLAKVLGLEDLPT